MYNENSDKVVGHWTKKTYTLLHKLGSGGVGEIYLVQDADGNQLALKVSTDLISITKEYRFLCQFQTESFVPKVYDLDDFMVQDRSYHYFTMEYIKGCDLKTALKGHNLTLQTKLRLMCVILQILDKINQQGFIYTDLKHENIMVDYQNMRINLIDFGSIVQTGSTVKEFTPMYDRLSWGKGKRCADQGYQSFAVSMLLITLLLNKSLDPNKDKLEPVCSSLRKKVPPQVYHVITKCINGQLGDCSHLYKEISCAAETISSPDRLKKALDLLIAALALTLGLTTFAFLK